MGMVSFSLKASLKIWLSLCQELFAADFFFGSTKKPLSPVVS